MTATAQINWTEYFGSCSQCRRRFRLTRETIEEQRRGPETEPGLTDQQIAERLAFCLGCAMGQPLKGEYIVPEIRENGRYFEARANTNEPWKVLEGKDSQAIPADEWGDGNALEVAAALFAVPVGLVINRTGAWHPTADCPCDSCEAVRLNVVVADAEAFDQAEPSVAHFFPGALIHLPEDIAGALSDALHVVLDGAPDEHVAALAPLQAVLDGWLSRRRVEPMEQRSLRWARENYPTEPPRPEGLDDPQMGSIDADASGEPNPDDDGDWNDKPCTRCGEVHEGKCDQ